MFCCQKAKLRHCGVAETTVAAFGAKTGTRCCGSVPCRAAVAVSASRSRAASREASVGAQIKPQRTLPINVAGP